MRKDFASCIVTVLCVAVVLFFPSTRAAGQENSDKHEPQGVNPAGGGVPAVSLKHLEAKTSGPTPRTADGKPDLSAVWGPGLNMGNIAVNLKPGDQLPLQPWALKLTQDRATPEAKRKDPKPNCLPDGVPREDPFPYKIVQTPKLIVFLLEGNVHSYRQIFMDGSGHPTDDLEPSYYGDSRGHWEGDTLVVDTIGFNDKTWFDGTGHPHTEKLHVIERYRRPDLANLEFEVTIDDPGAYTKPFTIYGHSPLLLNTDLMEYWCVENAAQDLIHIVGDSK